MTSAKDRTEICTFVVRIWLETDDCSNTWRGHATHVLSGERRYFDAFGPLFDFLTQHIDEMAQQIEDFE